MRQLEQEILLDIRQNLCRILPKVDYKARKLKSSLLIVRHHYMAYFIRIDNLELKIFKRCGLAPPQEKPTITFHLSNPNYINDICAWFLNEVARPNPSPAPAPLV